MHAYPKCGHGEIELGRVCPYLCFRMSAQPGVSVSVHTVNVDTVKGMEGVYVCGPYTVCTAECAVISATEQFTIFLGQAGKLLYVSICLCVLKLQHVFFSSFFWL